MELPDVLGSDMKKWAHAANCRWSVEFCSGLGLMSPLAFGLPSSHGENLSGHRQLDRCEPDQVQAVLPAGGGPVALRRLAVPDRRSGQ